MIHLLATSSRCGTHMIMESWDYYIRKNNQTNESIKFSKLKKKQIDSENGDYRSIFHPHSYDYKFLLPNRKNIIVYKLTRRNYYKHCLGMLFDYYVGYPVSKINNVYDNKTNEQYFTKCIEYINNMNKIKLSLGHFTNYINLIETWHKFDSDFNSPYETLYYEDLINDSKYIDEKWGVSLYPEWSSIKLMKPDINTVFTNIKEMRSVFYENLIKRLGEKTVIKNTGIKYLEFLTL